MAGDATGDSKADGISFYDYGSTTSGIWLLKHLSASGNTPFTYEYSPDNQVTKFTSPQYTEDYGYDNLERLTSWVKTGGAGNKNETYAYDAAGNTTNKAGRTFTYDAADRITSSSQYSDFAYDNNANLTRFKGSIPFLVETSTAHDYATSV